MSTKIGRRQMLKLTTAATTGLALSTPHVRAAEADPARVVRVGIVGMGGRGTHHMQLLCRMDGVQVRAVCDVVPERAQRARTIADELQGTRPEAYVGDPEAYLALCVRDDLDAVIIATTWDQHATMAVAAMKAGKYAASEVPCAVTIEQCWDLVRAREATGVPFMMLENWSFRRDNLAMLNLIRKGLLGEMVHCHCAHSHECISHWFFDRQGNDRWPARFLIEYNRDQYPTHSLGPVLSWMDINCGDAFATVASTATPSRGINTYFARTFGPDHPGAKRTYAQGDIVTSIVRTQKGRTIVVNYDMQLPRPYDNRWMIQGTLGIYREAGEVIYVLGRSPRKHEWEPFAPYQAEFDHGWWKNAGPGVEEVGHGGTDLIELEEFVRAVRGRTETPIDVYDSVTMSVLIPLSERSIARDGVPIECPDFTDGRWKTRKPAFGVES